MGDRGATGGAWGARDDASWWQGGAGELQQQQQQLNEEIARSTASTHQLYTYKMAGGFPNSAPSDTPSNYEYRMVSDSNTREEPSQSQQWWYASGTSESQQNSHASQGQSSPNTDQGNQSNGLQQQQNQSLQQQSQSIQQMIQQQHEQALQQHHEQALQHQQQALQQQQALHQQALQQQHQQALQQSLQHTLQVSQAQAQAIAQAAIQQQVQSLQQQQQQQQLGIHENNLHQLQAALHKQSSTFQVLQNNQALIAQSNAKRGRMPKAKPYNKPRGRMTAYAFFVQTCREEHKKKHPDESVVFAVFSKKCAERWNTMTEKEKERFLEMADKDKRRYDLEMQNYVPPKDVKVGRGKKRYQTKDPNAPKRSLSAFFWFCNDERPKVKGENPEYTMGDIAKELGRRWAAADPSLKTKYEQLSEKDKARYDREMTAYKMGTIALAQQQQAQISADIEEVEYEEEYN